MQGRWRRAALAATLVTTLLIPAVGSFAGVRERLRNIEAERDAIEQKIEIHEAEASTLRQHIDSLEEDLTALQKEIIELDDDIKRIESRVRSAQARIDATQAQIDRIKTIATEQAIELYKAGGTETLDALLNSESLAELDSRAELLGVAARENTGALVRYGRLRVEVQAQHRELFRIQEDLLAERKKRSIKKSELDRKKRDLNDSLAALNAKLESERNREGNLQDESDRIRGDLAAIAARNSVEKLGTSAQGFIWPLNGSVTSPYGYRWGRQHTGIDIEGYTGQPIVASKDGVVVMSEYYSGYGLTVVLDHGGGYATLYAHMSRTAVSGGEVEQGDVVGYVGCTGSCTGDHLHFEVRVNGEPRDPMDYLP
ncbi:MAG: murein hydrolase activator EnvC family protein [Actinomycetota bacterium]